MKNQEMLKNKPSKLSKTNVENQDKTFKSENLKGGNSINAIFSRIFGCFRRILLFATFKTTAFCQWEKKSAWTTAHVLIKLTDVRSKTDQLF